MVDESSSTIAVVPPPRLIVMNGTDTSQNLIVFNVNAQVPLKLTATNYSAWDSNSRISYSGVIYLTMSMAQIRVLRLSHPQPPPRQMKGARNYTGTLYLIFQTLVGLSLKTESKYHVQR